MDDFTSTSINNEHSHLNSIPNESISQGTYGCKLCPATFTNDSDFKQHCIIHPEYFNMDAFVCTTYVNSEKCDYNRNSSNDLSTYNCKFCPKTFANDADLKQHCIVHSDMEMEAFDSTSYVANTECDLNSNSKEIISTYDCKLCPETFINEAGLKQHCITVHPDLDVESFNSSSCVENEEYDLNRDSEEILSQETYNCKLCPEIFTNEDNFKQHCSTHPDYKPFSCHICQKHFKKKDNLKRHMRVHSNQKLFVCDLCDKGFTQKSGLKTHYYSHGEKPFVCNVCDHKFSRINDLSTHQLIHTDQKPFVCDLCHKSFRRKGTLNRHYITHSVVRPFVCDTCHKSYADKYTLFLHYRSHSDERPFSCDVCNKKFKRQIEVDKHYITHTGEKPFLCKQCNMGFTRKAALIRHQTYSCVPVQTCLITFDTSNSEG